MTQVQSAFQKSEFKRGQRVLYTATNNTKIPATILRINSRRTHAFCLIDGRVGQQYEPLHRFDALPSTNDGRILVVVRGSAYLAARRARDRGLEWSPAPRWSDARIGPDEHAGYVPAWQLGDVVRWYLEENTGNGECTYYARGKV